jgi:L-lactate permease
VIDTEGGPWGSAMDVIMCLLPIIFLVVVTIKPKPLPTTTSLPVAAIMMFLVRVMYLGSDPLLCSAAIISGLHEALSPITIMAGAIFLFETMEATLCMPYMMREMKVLTQGHQISELMLLFCFAYMVEGASGFGTPVALGAPMLVSLGYDKFQAVVTLLLMNTFATVWGAAGTPIWFGFGGLGLTEDELIEVSNKSAIALGISCYLLMPFVLRYSASWQDLRENKWFLLLSITTCVGPNIALSYVAYEFPSLLGGMVGCGLTAALISFRVGIKNVPHEEDEEGRHPLDIKSSASSNFSIVDKYENEQKESIKVPWNGEKEETSPTEDVTDAVKETESAKDSPTEAPEEDVEVEHDADTGATEETKPNKVQVDPFAGKSTSFNANDSLTRSSFRAIEMHLGPRKNVGEGYIKELIGRTFPLWGTVVILVVTRVPQIGLRDLMTQQEPYFEIFFQTYGTFRCSVALVLQLLNILTYPNLNWKYELLYVPFLIPFTVCALITMVIYRKDLQCQPKEIVGVVVNRIKDPAVALFGALVLVQLLLSGESVAPAYIIGGILSDAFGVGWIAIAAFIGALGSFFSGSTTISNLTFGEIQQIAAENIGISVTSLLAIQSCGGSAGNGICLVRNRWVLLRFSGYCSIRDSHVFVSVCRSQNNIIAACTVVGLNIGEGKVIGKTFMIVGASCVVCTCMILAFYIRFN